MCDSVIDPLKTVLKPFDKTLGFIDPFNMLDLKTKKAKKPGVPASDDISDEEAQKRAMAAAERAKRKARGAQGFSATYLTLPGLGQVLPANLQGKTLLGL